MTTSMVRGGRVPRRTLKSPLAAPGAPSTVSRDASESLALAPARAAPTDPGKRRSLNSRAISGP